MQATNKSLSVDTVVSLQHSIDNYADQQVDLPPLERGSYVDSLYPGYHISVPSWPSDLYDDDLADIDREARQDSASIEEATESVIASSMDGATRRELPSAESKFVVASRNRDRHEIQITDTKSTKPRTRKGLPLLFQRDTECEEVMTGHDTGTEANHMSLELVQKLGYKLETDVTDRGQFQLPNGKIIESVGRVTTRVQFAQGADSRARSFTCYFNVFPRLALPALMGMAFLRATETLTAYKCRFATLPVGWKRSLRLCAVGSAPNQVTCVLDGRRVRATADTGAELALVSGAYAMRHGLVRDNGYEEIEFADGSREYTSGFGDFELTIERSSACPSTSAEWRKKIVRFHVLDSLRFNVILDEDVVDDFNIFQEGLAVVLPTPTNSLPSLGPIVRLEPFERSVVDTKVKIRNWASSFLPTKTNKPGKCPCIHFLVVR